MGGKKRWSHPLQKHTRLEKCDFGYLEQGKSPEVGNPKRNQFRAVLKNKQPPFVFFLWSPKINFEGALEEIVNEISNFVGKGELGASSGREAKRASRL